MGVDLLRQSRTDLDGVRSNRFIVKVDPPVRAKSLEDIDERAYLLQFDEPLSRAALSSLDSVFERLPQLTLRVFTSYPEPKEFQNLNFLRLLPHVRRLVVQLPQLTNLSGLEFVIKQLDFFSLSFPRRKPSNLNVVSQATSLRGVCADDPRMLELLPRQNQLTEVRIVEFKSDFSEFITDLHQLDSLTLNQVKSESVSKLLLSPTVKRFQLSRCRGAVDLRFLEKLNQLETLSLDSVAVSCWPDFKELSSLRAMHLHRSFDQFEIGWLEKLTNLEELVLHEWPEIEIQKLAETGIVDRLRSFRHVLGKGMRSCKKDREVTELYPQAENSHDCALRYLPNTGY